MSRISLGCSVSISDLTCPKLSLDSPHPSAQPQPAYSACLPLPHTHPCQLMAVPGFSSSGPRLFDSALSLMPHVQESANHVSLPWEYLWNITASHQLCCHHEAQARDWQTLPGKGQMVNALGFSSHTASRRLLNPAAVTEAALDDPSTSEHGCVPVNFVDTEI